MGVSTKDSPCVGYCSTALGDEVCLGCGRTFQEVIDWIHYTDEQKAAWWGTRGGVVSHYTRGSQSTCYPQRD